jgi:hypothetical protein
MKFCYACGSITPGEPLYCSKCGCTYDVKLCPRHHANARGAEVCTKCGSKDLSKPQPRIPVALQLAAILIRLVLGLLLFYATLSLVVALMRSRQVEQFFVAAGILLAVLWGLWGKLPDWIQEGIRDFVIKRSARHDD